MNKNDILNKISSIDINPYLLEIIDKTNCFVCLDTNRLWRPRSNLPFDAWDGRGSYDIIKCNSCSNGAWVQCSHNNNIIVNEYPIFNDNNKNIEERIMRLKSKCKEYKKITNIDNNNNNEQTNLLHPTDEHVKNETSLEITTQEPVEITQNAPISDDDDGPIWYSSVKTKVIKDLTSIKVDVALKQLATDITNLIKSCGAEIVALSSLVENITVSIGGTIENSTDENRSIQKIKNKRKKDKTDAYIETDMYIELNFSKGVVIEDWTCCWYESHLNHTKLIVEILIYEPENEVAHKICEKKMNTVVAQIMELN